MARHICRWGESAPPMSSWANILERWALALFTAGVLVGCMVAALVR